jgi:hypothetical protein
MTVLAKTDALAFVTSLHPQVVMNAGLRTYQSSTITTWLSVLADSQHAHVRVLQLSARKIGRLTVVLDCHYPTDTGDTSNAQSAGHGQTSFRRVGRSFCRTGLAQVFAIRTKTAT